MLCVFHSPLANDDPFILYLCTIIIVWKTVYNEHDLDSGGQ